METIISLFLIFHDGSYSRLHDLEKATNFPDKPYILRSTYIGTKNGSFMESQTLEFIDLDGQLRNLRVGNWELLSIAKYHYQSVRTYYDLYDHSTKQAYNFKADNIGLDFIKWDLFPKLLELNGIPDYERYLFENRVSRLEMEMNKIKEMLERVVNK